MHRNVAHSKFVMCLCTMCADYFSVAPSVVMCCLINKLILTSYFSPICNQIEIYIWLRLVNHSNIFSKQHSVTVCKCSWYNLLLFWNICCSDRDIKVCRMTFLHWVGGNQTVMHRHKIALHSISAALTNARKEKKLQTKQMSQDNGREHAAQNRSSFETKMQ